MNDPMARRVEVFPFTRRVDGHDVILGRADGRSFLALPPDAVEILDDLAAGSTLLQAQTAYQERHAVTPDVLGLVVGLEAEGFIRREGAGGEEVAGVAPRAFHLVGITQSVARRIFSRPVLWAGALLVALGVAAVFAEPSIVPGPSALMFSHSIGIMVLWLVPLFILSLVLHEMAHLVAARARGVPASFGFSHRLWLLVVETDMSGIWTLPRRQRYLPILAGSFVDAVSTAALLLVLFLDARGAMALSATAGAVIRAMVIVYLYQILWQCFLFVRTDYYYAIANYFGCKSLMQDTVVALRNRAVRWSGRGSEIDQSHIPRGEMRIIRGYAGLWFGGRVLAIGLLVFVQIPIVLSYFKLMGRAARDMVVGSPAASLAILVPVVLALAVFSVGMFMWLRTFKPAAAWTSWRSLAPVPVPLPVLEEKGS